MGSAALGPFLAAAGLLVLAGLPKLRDPAPLVRALRSAGLPGGRSLVRVLAVLEVAAGLAALAWPGRITGSLVALAYLTFTAFVALALARGGVLASCGCFGRPDTPPTRAHLVVTAVLAASGVAVALDTEAAGPWWSAASSGSVTVVLAAYAVLVGVLAYLVIAVLPTLTPAAVRSASAPKRG
jgi:hypothetical protein